MAAAAAEDTRVGTAAAAMVSISLSFVCPIVDLTPCPFCVSILLSQEEWEATATVLATEASPAAGVRPWRRRGDRRGGGGC